MEPVTNSNSNLMMNVTSVTNQSLHQLLQPVTNQPVHQLLQPVNHQSLQQNQPVKTPQPNPAVRKNSIVSIEPVRKDLKTLPVNLYTPQGPATNRTVARTTSILQDMTKKSSNENYLMTRNHPIQTPKKTVDTSADLLSLQKLKISNQTLEKQVGNMMKTIESESITSKLNSMKILKLEEQVRNLTEDNKGLVSQRAILQKEIKDLKLKLASKQRSALEVKLKNMQYECEKSSVQSEEAANTMKAQMEQLKGNLGHEIVSLTKERDQLIKEKALIEYKLNESEKSFSDTNTTLIGLQEERNKLKEGCDHLESKNIHLTSHYELLKSEYDKILGENNSIKNQMDLLQLDKDNLISTQHNEVNNNRIEISKLQLNLESAKIEICKKDQKIEYLTHELRASQSKTEILQKEMDQTLSKLLKETSELSHLTDEYRSLSTSMDTLKGELTFAKHESSQYQTLMEDLRLRLKTLQMELEKSQKDKLQNTTELQIVRSDLDRLTLITNHLKEEKQIAHQEIGFLKTLNEEYLNQNNSVNQLLANERLEKSNYSNILSAQENEMKILKIQLEESKLRESSNLLKFDEKINSLQSRYETELANLRLSKSELEKMINDRETTRFEYEQELNFKIEEIKQQYEHQITEMTMNSTDNRRNYANLVHELSLLKREIERLKDLVKSREVKIEQQKEQLKRLQKMEEINDQMKDQISQKETALSSALSKNKQLQLNINTIHHSNTDQSKQKEEIEKFCRRIEELELENKSMNEKVRVSSLQIEELLKEQQNPVQPLSDKQKLDWITKVRKENLDLKQENSKLKETIRQSQLKLRQNNPIKNTTSNSTVARLKQTLPPSSN